ncbi:MAG TPA: methyl-accepting chemotaxis protein [Acetobacteraceae bacterium]|nr:methyl-accepting chemotaxis protein [Acetobacteraceae bacterium]
MHRYSDLRLVWKVLAAPAVVILLLAGVAAFGIRSLHQSDQAFQGLDSGVVQPLTDALGVKDRLSLFHARLLALLTMAANDKVVANTREAAIDRLEADLSASQDSVIAQSRQWTASLPADSVAAVQSALHDYVGAARAVADNAKADISYGVLMLSDANARFEVLRTRLDAVVATLQARREHLTAATRAASSTGRVRLAGLASLAALLGIGVAAWNARLIARPVVTLTGVMQRLAARDMAAEIGGAARKDELGAMARAVAVFKTSMQEEARLAARQEAERSAAQRRQSAMDRHTLDFGTSISGVMESLAHSAARMREAATTMTQAAADVRAQAGTTVTRATRASQDLAAVAAAVEQLTGSVDEVSRQVAASAQVAREAVQRAEVGHASMRGLADVTSRIGDVVSLISSIAGQTNLLALNATIEAARAGDAGKGFAVVAGEVKSLAAQTARATADIGDQIGAVRNATEQSVTAMAEVSQIIARMDAVAASVAAAVEQQSATTREIAVSVQAVSTATVATTHAMEQVSGVADEAGTVSQNVLRAAETIGHEAGTLRAEVDDFLAVVRDDTGERRQFERIGGRGAIAALRVAGREALRAEVVDISRSGVALRCEWRLPAGTEVAIELPQAGDWISARVVRCADRLIALVFKQDAATLLRVDRALSAIGIQQAA